MNTLNSVSTNSGAKHEQDPAKPVELVKKLRLDSPSDNPKDMK
jgi:hypothetical protein